MLFLSKTDLAVLSDSRWFIWTT